MKNKLLREYKLAQILGLLWIAMTFVACDGGANAALESPQKDALQAQQVSQPQNLETPNIDFESFCKNFPNIQLPHEIDPSAAKKDASGQALQGLPPTTWTSFLGRKNDGNAIYSAYGQYKVGNVTALIYQSKTVGTDDCAYFVRTFSKSGQMLAELEIAAQAAAKESSWRTYAKLSTNGEIISQGYQSRKSDDVMLRESYACYKISEATEFETCATPPATLFLGRFKSPQPVDGDGGYDVWSFTTYIPKGEKAPKVLLRKCYQNDLGKIDGCKDIGLVTKEVFDGDSFKLIIDNVTGEMVPTYTIQKGKRSAWTLLAHWYDVESDSWIDDELHSEF